MSDESMRPDPIVVSDAPPEGIPDAAVGRPSVDTRLLLSLQEDVRAARSGRDAAREAQAEWSRRARLAEYKLRAVEEDVRPALMWLEEVILRLPGRWNDPLVPDECAPALQAAYKAINDFSARTP